MHSTVAMTAKGPIEYRIEGAGPVVVVLNGGHCSRESRLSHERLAESGFTLLTPSRPGYDRTPAYVGCTAQSAAAAIAALLDHLGIAEASIIGISAAGPTALAFAQQYPQRTRRLVLESAVTLPWEESIKRPARRLFGRMQSLTWAMVRLGLRIAPALTLKSMLRELTSLEVDHVFKRMSGADLAFVTQMLRTSDSGTGFLCDLEHRVEALGGITAPVLVLYSPHDRSVPPAHARRVQAEVASCEVYEVPADTHLIWIGGTAAWVWGKRLSFLTA